MEREIKFRAWDKYIRRMDYSLQMMTLAEIQESSHPFMQYTGLKDKNGVEIYEGDIVAYHSFTRRLGEQYHKRIVQWNTDGAHFEMIKVSKYIGDPKAGQRSFFADYKNKKLEIIGNIYENPELLEAKS